MCHACACEDVAADIGQQHMPPSLAAQTTQALVTSEALTTSHDATVSYDDVTSADDAATKVFQRCFNKTTHYAQ